MASCTLVVTGTNIQCKFIAVTLKSCHNEYQTLLLLYMAKFAFSGESQPNVWKSG